MLLEAIVLHNLNRFPGVKHLEGHSTASPLWRIIAELCKFIDVCGLVLGMIMMVR